MIGGDQPLGSAFNPFDPEVQAQLNEIAEAASRFKELEEDLQRVVVQTWPKGGGGEIVLSRFMAVSDGANPIAFDANNNPIIWQYGWRKGELFLDDETDPDNPVYLDIWVATAPSGEDEAGVDFGNWSTDPPTHARNLAEQENIDALVIYGTQRLITGLGELQVLPIPDGNPVEIIITVDPLGIKHFHFEATNATQPTCL